MACTAWTTRRARCTEPGYQAPEVGETGPTIAADLFTVARTLAVLATDFAASRPRTASRCRQGERPAVRPFDSLYRLLERATAADPDERFQSADEMGDQLLGVLREVVADRSTADRARAPASRRGARPARPSPTGERCRCRSSIPTTRPPR